MKTAEVKAVFDVLQPELTAIVRDAGEPADNSFLTGDFPLDAQVELYLGILRAFGFPEGTFRLDETVHPFATTFSSSDIRMTTRYRPDSLRALWSTMHEAGHGLSYLGIAPELGRSPLYGNASLGLGESQSRTWENLVGRSLPFWRGRYGRCSDASRSWQRSSSRLLPRDQPRRADRDACDRRRGHLLPPHHPPLRARAGARGRHARARRSAGGLDREDGGPPRRRGRGRPRGAAGRALDARLVRLLPDVRPRQCALGADLALTQEELPDLDDQLEAGEFGRLYESLRRRIYRHGRKFTPMETLERAIGADEIDPEPYLGYLRAKVAGLQPA